MHLTFLIIVSNTQQGFIWVIAAVSIKREHIIIIVFQIP